jgi:endonuclease YncB( thermonuclease family)
MFRSRQPSLSFVSARRGGWRLPGVLAVVALLLAFAAGVVLQARMGFLPGPDIRQASETIGSTGDVAPPAQPAGHAYRGRVLRVIDGDTVEARLQTWPGQEVVTLVRLRGIDTPELAGACAQEQSRAVEARDALVALVGDRPVTVTDVGPDKFYGRVVARLLTADGTDAGQALLDRGLARFYARGQREGWCQVAGNGAKG